MLVENPEWTCQWKSCPPLWGFPGSCQKTTAPDAPASLFPDPNRAQIKDCIDNKTVEKKGAPTPSGRAHHRWCPWVDRKIGGAFQKPVAFSKGWMTGHGKRPPNVSVLFRGCGFEICVVIGWIYPPKIANISQIRVEIQGPQLQELRHVSCFWVNGPQKSCNAFPRKSRKTPVPSGHVSWYLKR